MACMSKLVWDSFLLSSIAVQHRITMLIIGLGLYYGLVGAIMPSSRHDMNIYIYIYICTHIPTHIHIHMAVATNSALAHR